MVVTRSGSAVRIVPFGSCCFMCSELTSIRGVTAGPVCCECSSGKDTGGRCGLWCRQTHCLGSCSDGFFSLLIEFRD